VAALNFPASPVSGTEYQARVFNLVAGTASARVIRIIII